MGGLSFNQRQWSCNCWLASTCEENRDFLYSWDGVFFNSKINWQRAIKYSVAECAIQRPRHRRHLHIERARCSQLVVRACSCHVTPSVTANIFSWKISGQSIKFTSNINLAGGHICFFTRMPSNECRSWNFKTDPNLTWPNLTWPDLT